MTRHYGHLPPDVKIKARRNRKEHGEIKFINRLAGSFHIFQSEMAAKPLQIAILGAGIFVRTQYIPRLSEISDLVLVKAIWSRTEVLLFLITEMLCSH